jgi:hypothetical protein
MSNEYDDTSLLLGMISYSLRKPEQVAEWEKAGASPTYKLLRQPKNLEELIDGEHGIAIWRDNGTLTYVSRLGIDESSQRDRSLTIVLGSNNAVLQIFGDSDDVICETAAYFMSFVETACEKCLFGPIRGSERFNLLAAGSDWLYRLLTGDPRSSPSISHYSIEC